MNANRALLMISKQFIFMSIPTEHQTLLFSSTMPAPIKRIGSKYYEDTEHVSIKATTLSDAFNEQVLCSLQRFPKKFRLLLTPFV